MSKEEQYPANMPPLLKPVWSGYKDRDNTFFFGDGQTYPQHWNKDKIGQTGFCRFGKSMEALARFFMRLPPQTLHMLSAPCSVGCEPYSLAMLMLAQGVYDHHKQVAIDSFDLSARFMDAAREGAYPASMTEPAAPYGVLRYFDFEGGTAHVKTDIKSRVNFLPPQDICAFHSETPYDVMMIFNLLCKLDTEQSRQLGETLAQQSPAILMINNLRHHYTGDPKRDFVSRAWADMDGPLKRAGYIVLHEDFEAVSRQADVLYLTNRAIGRSSYIILGQPEKLKALGLREPEHGL